MRTQTFISSMVGVAGAVSVAGSAMGAVTSVIIDPFTTATTAAQANSGAQVSPIGGAFAVRYMSPESGITASVAAASGKMVGTWAARSEGETLTASWHNNFGDPATNLSGCSSFDFFVGGSNIADMSFSMEFAGDNGAGSWDYRTGRYRLFAGWNTMQLIDFNNPAYPNMAAINTSSAQFVSLFLYGSPSGQNVEISNFTAAVPAPGAAALIGLAGLVATRRRRN